MKGRLWCEGLPQVALAPGPRKPITLIVPYYENRAFFGAQLRKWSGYADHLREMLRVIVVDDGSPKYPAEAVARQLGPFPFAFRLFRIEVDVRWNWLAARNRGFAEAGEGWCLVTDMDHVLPEETLAAISFGVLDARTVYAFGRREHTGARIAPHSASFLMTRATFWRIGGYDEALSGYYGTDGVYRRELVKHASLCLLDGLDLVRHEYVEDSSTATYLRKQPQDAAVGRLVRARAKNWTPRVLSYPCHEVALWQPPAEVAS